MKAIKKFTRDDLKLAKKAGFKKTAPKKPKQSASLSAFENYVEKYNNYVDDMKAKAKEAKEREKAKKIIAGI